MGYTTYGISVEIAKVKEFIFSRDESCVAIEAPDIFPPTDFKLDGQSYPAKSALCDLIAWRLERSAAVPDLFVYALEAIYKHLGKRLDGDSHIKFLDDLDWPIAYTPINEYFGFPAPSTFPDARIISSEQIRQQFDEYESDTDHEDGTVADAREEYVWWLKQCIDFQSDLVTYCY